MIPSPNGNLKFATVKPPHIHRILGKHYQRVGLDYSFPKACSIIAENVF